MSKLFKPNALLLTTTRWLSNGLRFGLAMAEIRVQVPATAALLLTAHQMRRLR